MTDKMTAGDVFDFCLFYFPKEVIDLVERGNRILIRGSNRKIWGSIISVEDLSILEEFKKTQEKVYSFDIKSMLNVTVGCVFDFYHLRFPKEAIDLVECGNRVLIRGSNRKIWGSIVSLKDLSILEQFEEAQEKVDFFDVTNAFKDDVKFWRDLKGSI